MENKTQTKNAPVIVKLSKEVQNHLRDNGMIWYRFAKSETEPEIFMKDPNWYKQTKAEGVYEVVSEDTARRILAESGNREADIQETAKTIFAKHYNVIAQNVQGIESDLSNIAEEVLISILSKHHALCSLDTLKDFIKEHGVEKLDKLKLELEMI